MMKDVYWWTVRSFKNRAVKIENLKDIAREFGKGEKEIIEYLVRIGLALRIVEDIYFIKDPANSLPLWIMIARGLNRAGVKWYYGLYSAWMNGRMVQQVYLGEVIVNNKYSGKRKIGGVDVYFFKTRRDKFFTFGIEEFREGVYRSDPEKTVLDFIYFGNYGKIPSLMVSEVIDSYFDPDNSLMYFNGRNYERMKEYLKYYPDFVKAELYGFLRRPGEYFYYEIEVKEVFAL